MNILTAVLLITTATSSILPLKCPRSGQMPGYAENEPVVLLDGRIVRPGPDQSLQDLLGERGLAETDDIGSIAITCWRPGEKAFSAGPGIQLIRIHTKSALARARKPLEALLAAQEALLEQDGRHARSVDELFGHGLPRDADLRYSASDLAWNASAPASPGAYRCSVSFLTIEAGDGTPEISCEKDDTKDIAALQELYDSGGE